MEPAFYAIIFFASGALLYLSGEWVVGGLIRLSRLLGIREFILAFFVMAMAASIPNLFMGLTSALKGIPELSLGDVFGNNLIAMTLAVSAGVFFSARKFIEVRGQTIRTSLLFMSIAATLPIVLLLDGNLDRIDGLILLGSFILYVSWLISQEDRFSKTVNEGIEKKPRFFKNTRKAFLDTVKIFAGIALILLASFGIVSSASFFAVYLGVPLLLVGLLITGIGNALPEVYFSAASARRGETGLIMGNLIGSVIVPATLVLGLVALIHPIHIDNIEFIAESRGFLIVATILFFIFASTRKRIGRAEAVILFLLYFSFVVWAVLFSQ